MLLSQIKEKWYVKIISLFPTKRLAFLDTRVGSHDFLDMMRHDEEDHFNSNLRFLFVQETKKTSLLISTHIKSFSPPSSSKNS